MYKRSVNIAAVVGVALTSVSAQEVTRTGVVEWSGTPTYRTLIRDETVRHDLNITDEQYSQLKTITDDTRVTPVNISYRTLTNETAFTEFANALLRDNERQKDCHKKFAGILNLSQMNGLRLRWLEYSGATRALLDEDVANELRVTDDQRSQMMKWIIEYTVTMHLLLRFYLRLEAQPNLEPVFAIQRTYDKLALELLTDQQTTKFTELLAY
jgi:hypothetical protein